MYSYHYTYEFVGRLVRNTQWREACTTGMDSSDSANETPRGQRTKVARLIDEYDLQRLASELVDRWTADADRHSLRELADYFNRHLLRAEMEAAGMQPLEGEVDNLYRLLDGDDVSSGARVEADRRLEKEGIDVEELRSDFVSHQAIHTYLTKDREVEPPTSADGDPIAKSQQSIQRLQSRTSAVVENTLSNLQRNDEFDLPEFDVFVDIQVVCTGCRTQYDVIDLLEQDGCGCTDGQ